MGHDPSVESESRSKRVLLWTVAASRLVHPRRKSCMMSLEIWPGAGAE